jgi:hypothetical protein
VTWASNDSKIFEGVFEPQPPRFETGRPSGKMSWWYEKGTDRAQFEFARGGSGIADGRARFWNHDGRAIYDVSYRQGKPDGSWTAWHPDGKKAFEGGFKDGKREGVWRYTYADGKPGLQAEYRQGEPAGEWTAWRRGGAQAFKMRFEAGKLKEIRGDEPTPDFYKTPKSELGAQFKIQFPHSVDEAYTSIDFTKSPDDMSPAIPPGSIDEQILSGEFERTLKVFGELLLDAAKYGKKLSPFGEPKGSSGLSQGGWLKFDVAR